MSCLLQGFGPLYCLETHRRLEEMQYVNGDSARVRNVQCARTLPPCFLFRGIFRSLC